MRSALVALALAVPALAAGQSSPVSTIARCESLVVLQATAAQSRVRPYSLSLHAGNGAELTYFGTRHTNDPADTQFVSLQAEWRKSNPTIAFYEGTTTRSLASANEAISTDAEPGLLRFLAAQSGVATRSIEPSREDEVNALLPKFTPEQLVMFFTLRPVAEQRRHVHRTPSPLSALERAAIATVPGWR